MDGDTIVVGAPGEDGAAGEVFVYIKPNGGWESTPHHMAKLTAPGGARRDGFGTSVAADGDTIVVGAPGMDTHGEESGAVYVFTKPDGGWGDAPEPTAVLSVEEDSPRLNLGVSVSVSGDVIAAGTSFSTWPVLSRIPNTAYVFTRPDGGWVTTSSATARLALDDDNSGLQFGASVSVSGDTLVVGAPVRFGIVSGETGVAHVFTRPDDGWGSGDSTSVELTAFDGTSGHEFGSSVSADGVTIAIGAPMADGTVFESGAVYVFKRPEDGWTATSTSTKLQASDTSSRQTVRAVCFGRRRNGGHGGASRKWRDQRCGCTCTRTCLRRPHR